MNIITEIIIKNRILLMVLNINSRRDFKRNIKTNVANPKKTYYKKLFYGIGIHIVHYYIINAFFYV